MMPIQRACGAEMQARNKLSNGPLRVRIKAVFMLVFRNVWHTLFAGDMIVSC